MRFANGDFKYKKNDFQHGKKFINYVIYVNPRGHSILRVVYSPK